MKGDFSRVSFSPEKRYHGLRMQQGRVQTDADWNEQARTQEYLQQAALTACIGQSGTPRAGAGFAVSAISSNGSPDLALSPGRYFVDGMLCELFASASGQGATYLSQPDLPAPPPLSTLAAGSYLVYLDVWSRHLTALEDPTIADPALMGSDTATRLQTVWQAKLLPLPAGTLADSPLSFASLLPPSGLLMKARANALSGMASGTMLPPGSGYRRLDNQLYRVEIHDAPTATTAATFKWSRENGSIAAAWVDQHGNDLILSYPARDESLDFGIGDWIEITDDTRELLGQKGVMVQVDHVEGHILTINPPKVGTLLRSDFPSHPKVRRWDMASGPIAITKSSWMALEDGVEVWFEGDSCRSGDYWLIPARAATRDIEWVQQGGQPALRKPQGIAHHYVDLAQFDWDGTSITNLADRRQIFAPLGAGLVRGSDDTLSINASRDYAHGVSVSGQLSLGGPTSLNDNKLLLRSGSDGRYGLGYHGTGKTFAGQSLDGPALFGAGGGALGTAADVASGVAGSVVLNGNGDYVTLPTLAHDFSQGFTIAAWVKYDAFLNYSRVVDLSNGPGADNILLANNGTTSTLCLNVFQGSAGKELNVAGVLELGVWTHIAVSVNSQGVAKAYKNGSQVGSGTVLVPRSGISRTKCYIGKSAWAENATFSGRIANVQLWTRPLSATEIADSAANIVQMSAQSPGLVGSWRLGDGSGTTAYDESKFAQHGTLTASAAFESYQQLALSWDSNRSTATGGQLSLGARAGLNDNSLHLRQISNANHGLGYHGSSKPFAGLSVDGPALYGYGGGVLGSVQAPRAGLVGCAVFDGSGYMDMGSVAYEFSQGLTIEAWVKYDAFQYYSRIVDIGGGANADNIILSNIATNNGLSFGMRQGANAQWVNMAGVLELGVWLHIAATVDSKGNVKLYKNGAVVGTGVVLPSLPRITRAKSYIGKSNWSSDSNFKGRMAMVRLWTRPLSDTEISNSMNNAVPIGSDASGLVANWRMADGSGTTARDYSQYAKNATLTGGVTFETYQKAALQWDGNQNVTVSGAATLSGGATINGGATVDSATVSGALSAGSLSVNGSATLKSTLTVSSSATLGSLSVSGNIAQNGTDFLLDNTSRRGSNLTGMRRALVHDGGDMLTINYAGDYTGGAKVNSALTVTGATTVTSTLTVTGRIKASGNARAVVTANSNRSYPTSTTTWTTLDSMSTTFTAAGDVPILFLFSAGGCQSNAGSTRWQFRLLLDSTVIAYTTHEFFNGGFELRDIQMFAMSTPSAGSHTISAQCCYGTGNGALTISWYSDTRTLMLMEV